MKRLLVLLLPLAVGCYSPSADEQQQIKSISQRIAKAVVTPSPWITPCDLDRDGDVDLTDYGYFAACFNGTNNPPAPDCVSLVTWINDARFHAPKIGQWERVHFNCWFVEQFALTCRNDSSTPVNLSWQWDNETLGSWYWHWDVEPGQAVTTRPVATQPAGGIQ